jgi:hypothetical protein
LRGTSGDEGTTECWLPWKKFVNELRTSERLVMGIYVAFATFSVIPGRGMPVPLGFLGPWTASQLQ